MHRRATTQNMMTHKMSPPGSKTLDTSEQPTPKPSGRRRRVAPYGVTISRVQDAFRVVPAAGALDDELGPDRVRYWRRHCAKPRLITRRRVVYQPLHRIRLAMQDKTGR